MIDLQNKMIEAAEFIRGKAAVFPQVAIVLGSGLSEVVKEIKANASIDYSIIPHFPVSTVEGHSGKLMGGEWDGKQIWIMSGRFHYYEGYTMQQVTFPIRVLKHLGVQTIFITNASGGLNPEIKTGELMVVTDHINLNPDNPLRGKNDIQQGPRFPDQHAVYDKDLIQKAGNIAYKHQIKLHQGIYVGVPGPAFETPAEYRYMRMLGGDAVGMSTVPEVMVANYLGMRIFCLSIICDEGNQLTPAKVSHDEVVKAAKSAEPRMGMILKELLSSL
jgi:purine-nucleoside phosphorylase